MIEVVSKQRYNISKNKIKKSTAQKTQMSQKKKKKLRSDDRELQRRSLEEQRNNIL